MLQKWDGCPALLATGCQLSADLPAKGYDGRNGVRMPYANGGDPMVGDRLSDKRGRVGTVTHITFGPRNPTELAIRWDDGIVGIRYPDPGDFTLISRAPESA